MFISSPKASPRVLAPSAKRQAPSAKRQAPSAKRQAPSAKRQALIFHSIHLGKWQNCILLLGILWGGLLIAAGCDGKRAARSILPKSDASGQASLPLVPSESPLNLGEVPAGGQKQYDFWLTNRTVSPVEVAKIETTCDCVMIDLPNRVLSPAQKVAGKVLLDLRKEPRFSGNLSIEVKGKDKIEQIVFALVVKVAVGSE